MIAWIPLVLALLGLGLSWYAFHVAQFAGTKKGYHPLCDINEKSSCSKAFTSEYGKTLGMFNGEWGMLFYTILVVLALLGEIQWMFLLACLSVIGSLYLAYILYFKVKTFCVVCTSVYITNLLFALSTYLLGF